MHYSNADLHDNGFVGIISFDQLKVLDRSQLDSSPEVQAPASQGIVPMRRFISELDSFLRRKVWFARTDTELGICL